MEDMNVALRMFMDFLTEKNRQQSNKLKANRQLVKHQGLRLQSLRPLPGTGSNATYYHPEQGGSSVNALLDRFQTKLETSERSGDVEAGDRALEKLIEDIDQLFEKRAEENTEDPEEEVEEEEASTLLVNGGGMKPTMLSLTFEEKARGSDVTLEK